MKKIAFGKTFSERVVELAQSIPPGRVTTYGDLARSAGAGPMAAQSITSILSKAAQAGTKNIPFHRIVYANGKIWVGPSQRKERLRLYKNEGIEIDDKDSIVDFENIRIFYKKW